MVKEPATLVEPLRKAGASSVTFHIESEMPEGGVPAMIKMVRDAGMGVGIVIKPDTPVDVVFPYVSFPANPLNTHFLFRSIHSPSRAHS